MKSINLMQFFRINLRNFIHRLNKMISDNDSIMDEVVISNIHRMYIETLIAIPVHITIILIIWISPISESASKWRMGIMIIHGIQSIIMVIFAMVVSHLRKNPINTRMYLLQYAFILSILIVGIALTAVDQYVTTNITPFLLVCTITGTFLLMRPLVSILVNITAFILYAYTIGLIQIEPSIILTNRINGIAAVSIGFCISLLLWNTNLTTIKQRKEIENQQRKLEEHNQVLKQLAYLDALTGLYSRRQWIELVNNEIELIHRYGHESSLIMMDVDYFKKINDDYGHPAGDKVLKVIADIFINQLRTVDKAARWGGEEFIIFLPQTSLSNAIIAAEKLRYTIENTTISVDNHQMHITASFGVAQLSNEDDSFKKNYTKVDQALYQAKHNGKNCVEVIG